MQLEAVARIHIGVESALDRAAAFMQTRGYRTALRKPGEAVFRRGSLSGSLTGMTPARWAARTSVSRIDASSVRVVVRANDTFQVVTEGERTFWAEEIAQLLAVLERSDPPPAGAVRERPPARSFFEGTAPTLITTAAGAVIGTALRGLAELLRLLPFDFNVAPGAWWKWAAVGAVLGFGGAVRYALRTGNLEETISRIAGTPLAQGKTWEPPPSWTPSGNHKEVEGIVIVEDRDYADAQEGIAKLLAGWQLPVAPVRIVVHPAAADRDMAEGLAVQQLLIAGVSVDRSRLGSSPIETKAGRIGTVVTQWYPRGAQAGPHRIERFDRSAILLGRALGLFFIAGGLWFGWEGLARGRELVATDTSKALHLVVERKVEIAGFFPDHRVSGRIAETGDAADVSVFRSQFDALRPGNRLEVYRKQPGQPVFVARRRYESAWPLIPVPRMPFTWEFLLGALFFGIGIAIARSAR